MIKALNKKYHRLLALGITEGADTSTRQSLRTLNRMSFILLGVGLPFVIYFWFVEVYYLASVLTIAMVLCALNVYFTWRYRSVTFSAHFFLLLITLTFILTNLRTGGFTYPHFGWTYIIPIIGGLLLGRWGLFFYLMLQTLLTLAFYAAWRNGIVLPNVIVAEQQALLALMNRVSAVVGLSLIVYVFITEREFNEKQLVKAKSQAESGNRAKSEFLATMSHEIRTPLNGVLGMAELMSTTTLSQEQIRLLTSIQSSSRSLLTVLNDVLDYSKIESGKMELEQCYFDLPELVHETVALFSLRASESGVELLVFIDPVLPSEIEGDPVRIKQVLINLLGNAFKFTEAGEIQLIISPDLSDLDASGVYFEVVDTGIGISPQQQVHLFESFSQADTSTTRKYGGSGLGLSICRRLVSLMGGKIGVESAEGKGAKFWFTVSARYSKDNMSCQLDDLKGMRILIADNSRTRGIFTEKSLNAYGMSTEFAWTESGLLTKLAACDENHSYDVVLVDGKFSGGNGARILNEYSRQPVLKLTKFILLNNLEAIQFSKLERYRSIDFVIEKPLLINELITLVLRRRSIGGVFLENRELENYSFPNFRILIVEDNNINQAVVEGMLDLMGAAYTSVPNGKEALRVLSHTEYAYDMVLMDCEMPVMDGLVATRKIRQAGFLDKVGKPIPVIALSAHAREEKKIEAYEAGMNYFMTKPIEIKEIADVISRVEMGEFKTDNASLPAVSDTVAKV